MNAMISLLRPRQWASNALVFGALFFSGEITRPASVAHVAVVFVVFCLLSSATYIFNDWCDIEADRLNPTKRERPLAAGTVGVAPALVLMLALYAAAVGIGLLAQFSGPLWVLLGAYVAINLGYSLGLKHVAVVELFCVASGFVIRFFAGVVEVGVTA